MPRTLLAVALSSIACATAAPPPLRHAIRIVNADPPLADALRWALAQNGYLSPPDAKAAVDLEATLVGLEQPVAGATVVVDTFVRYKLHSSDGKKVFFDDVVRGSFTTEDDALHGAGREKFVNK